MERPEGPIDHVTPNDIKFVCEQDGPSEHQLKEVLSHLFRADRRVHRAYLVRAMDRRTERVNAMLCLSLTTCRSDPLLMRKISDCFASIFAASEYLDILVLNNLAEELAANVAKPFYERKREKWSLFQRADLYLVCEEGIYRPDYFSCIVHERLTVGSRDGLLVQLTPALRYDDLDGQLTCLEQVILVARYEGESIIRNRKWPITVNVIRPARSVNGENARSQDKLPNIIALGSLHKSRRAAKADAKSLWDAHTHP